MEDTINLFLPFLVVPENYADVLKKLASFGFYETYAITFMLRSDSAVDKFFSSLESSGPIGKAVGAIPGHESLNVSGIAIALLIAALAFVFHLHDRISDVTGIRRRYDRKHILVPLAHRVGSTTGDDKFKKIGSHRDELMRAVFYKYASSTIENPLVDKHDITQALNAWSWFWVFVEGTFYFGLATIVAWLLDSNSLVRLFVWISCILLGLALVQRPRLNRYARPQVQAIAADATAALAVKQAFDAL